MKNHEFMVEFGYTQEYLPSKRCSVPRQRVLTAEAAFTVPELTEDEFPVALITRTHEAVADGATEDTIGSAKSDYRIFSEEYRFHNGKLYRPVRPTWGARVSTLIRTPDCLPGLAKWRSQANDPSGYNLYADMPFTEKSAILSDDREAHEEAIRESAGSFVVFSGGVWEEAGEPMYVVITFGLGHNHGGTGFFIEGHYNPNIPARNYFRADRLDDALAYFNKVAAGRGDTDSVGRYDGREVRVDILMPEALKRDPAKDHADGGDPFMEKMESVISRSATVGEAGLLAMCMAMAEVSAS